MPEFPMPPHEDFSHRDDDKSQQSNKFKRPEFIIIDDTKEYVYGSPHASQSGSEEDELWEMQRKKNPLWLRMLCLLGVLFCLFFASAVLSYVFFLALLSILSLFQNKELNRSFFASWKLFTNTLVSAVSLTIGFFSPTLGLGMLILYFSMKGRANDRAFLKNMFKKFL